MIEEFKKFILRGNVLDLAIGVIIGAAFGAIVKSLVDDIINPIIGFILGGRADFTGYSLALSSNPDGPVLAYGAFITAIINFLIIAVILFFILRSLNRFFARAAAQTVDTPPAPTKEEVLLTEIRDSLRQRPVA
jgi:large conductance mechanosensitive channel